MDSTVMLLVAPIFAFDVVMKVLALTNLSKQPRVRGPKVMWVLVILLVTIFGWALYYLIGREEQ